MRRVDLQYLQSPFLIGQACSQGGEEGGGEGEGGGREREGEGRKQNYREKGGRGQYDAHLKETWQYWGLVN